MNWTAGGRYACCCCWRRLEAQSHSGLRTLKRSQHPTVRRYLLPHVMGISMLLDKGCPKPRLLTQQRAAHNAAEQCISIKTVASGT